MRFAETALSGAYVVDIEPIGDERGFFARSFCQREFAVMGVSMQAAQMNTSFNRTKGTLRGMHYQLPPHEECKLIRCLKGALYDVVLDLRPSSPTYGKHFGMELSEQNRSMLLIPQGCAHGFMTLEENTELLYMVSAFYAPDSERCVRWDDPRFAIQWPMEPTVISERDAQAPLFSPDYHLEGIMEAMDC